MGDNHSSEETISYTLSSRLELLDQPLLEVDHEWITDRSRYVLER
jgi:hypothetical protein